MWAPVEGPAGAGGRLGPRDEKVMGISFHFGRKPIGTRVGTDHHEQAFQREVLLATGDPVSNPYLFQPPIPLPANDFCVQVDVNGGMSRDRVDEVGGHAVAEVRSSYDQVDGRAVPGQVQHRLPRRIARTNYGRGQPSQGMCRRDTGAVVDAVTSEIIQARQSQTSVCDAARNHHGPRTHIADIANVCPEAAGVTAERVHFTSHKEAGTENPRLLITALSKIRAAEPAREPEVVADQ